MTCFALIKSPVQSSASPFSAYPSWRKLMGVKGEERKGEEEGDWERKGMKEIETGKIFLRRTRKHL